MVSSAFMTTPQSKLTFFNNVMYVFYNVMFNGTTLLYTCIQGPVIWIYPLRNSMNRVLTFVKFCSVTSL